MRKVKLKPYEAVARPRHLPLEDLGSANFARHRLCLGLRSRRADHRAAHEARFAPCGARPFIDHRLRRKLRINYARSNPASGRARGRDTAGVTCVQRMRVEWNEALPTLRRMSNEKPVELPPASGSAPPEPFYIPATEPATRLRRTMKHGDCFVMVDTNGDIGAAHGGPDGLFYLDTRYLSHFEMLIN